MKPKKKKDHDRKLTGSKRNAEKGERKEESKQKNDITVNKSAPRNHSPDDDPKSQKKLEEGLEDQIPTASTSFASRKIESNWSRYEDDGQDTNFDDDQRQSNIAIGIDFEVALNAAREVGEQFRFREEKEWDNVEEDDENGVESLDYSWLDVEDQVLSLSCITLPQKLDLDEAYFLPETIEEYEKISQLNRELLDKKRTTISESVKMEPDDPDVDVERKIRRSAEEDDELDVLLRMAEHRSKTENDESSTSSASIVSASETTFKTENQSNNNNSTDIQSLEDWLDTVILD